MNPDDLQSQLQQMRAARSNLDSDDPRHPFLEALERGACEALGEPGPQSRRRLPPVTMDELAHEYVHIKHAVECLAGAAPWLPLARLCYERTRQHGAGQRVYGMLWGVCCEQVGARPPSKRTFDRLVRLGALLDRWDVREEDVRGLSWRQAYDVLRAAADEVKEHEGSDGEALSSGDVRERLREAPRHLL